MPVELQLYSWQDLLRSLLCSHSPCWSSDHRQGQSPATSPELQRDPSPTPPNREETLVGCHHRGTIHWPLGQTHRFHGDHHRCQGQGRPGCLGPREMLTGQFACSWRLFQRERERERERERIERELWKRRRGRGENVTTSQCGVECYGLHKRVYVCMCRCLR